MKIFTYIHITGGEILDKTMQYESCDSNIIHEEIISKVRKSGKEKHMVV